MKFADTSWWVAWALPGDARHHVAVSLAETLGRNEMVLTTNHVIGESWTFLRRRGGHPTAVAFLDRIDLLRSSRKIEIHQVTAKQEAAALTFLRRRVEREYSFVDATSFVTMRDRRLREAFAFDHDFAAAGFVEVVAPPT